MPRQPLIFTDHHSLTVPAFTLGNRFTCSGTGLCYDQKRRMSVEELSVLVNPQTPPGQRDKQLYQPFLYAQCRMLLEPGQMPSEKDNLKTLQSMLWDAIQAGQTTPPELLALEQSANLQFHNMLGRIHHIISTMQYMPTTANPQNDLGPPAKKTKRKRPSKGSLASCTAISHNTGSPALLMDPTVPGAEVMVGMSLDVPLPPPTVTAAIEPQPYKRGDRPAAINTELNRARRPKSTAQSFLLQLMVDTSKLPRAIEIARSESVPTELELSAGITDSEAHLRTEFVNLVQGCALSSRGADSASYKVMLMHAKLALWCLRVKDARPKFTMADAYRLLDGSGVESMCNEAQFRSWHSYGHILLRLIHASSIHILLAIAVSTSRDVTNHLAEPILSEVENALRQPDLMEGVLPGLMFTGIIQFVRNMQNAIPGGVQLGGHIVGVNQVEDDRRMTEWLRCGSTDFAQIPRGSHWYDQCSPFPPPRTFDRRTAPFPTKIIKTNFDPELDGNKLLPAELRTGGKSAHIPFTEIERGKALNASCPGTLEDLEAEACAQLDTGVKKPDSYIKVLPELFSKSNILIHGVGGKEKGLICFILSRDTLTPAEMDYFLQITLLTLGMSNEVVDTTLIGPGYTFKGYHFGAWGKMSKSGKLAPKEVHPRVYLGESSQPAPYLDRAVRLLTGSFNTSHFLHCPQAQFNNAVQVILQPALAKLKEQIPGLLEQHQTLFDSLNPAMHQLGSAPFCMTVLNVQPMTRAHRDASDAIDSICLILSLGDFEGGGLCLYAGGFCIPLPHGTFMAIPSKQDLHFNLHFKGQRFSYVFTSDGGLRRWATHRNHMKHLLSQPSAEDEENDLWEGGSEEEDEEEYKEEYKEEDEEEDEEEDDEVE